LIERYMVNAEEAQTPREVTREARHGQVQIEAAPVARVASHDQQTGGPTGRTEPSPRGSVKREELGPPARSDWRAQFPEAYRENGSVASSAGLDAVSREADPIERPYDELFALAFEETRADALGSVEEARRDDAPGSTVSPVQHWEIQPDGARVLVKEGKRSLPALEDSLASDDGNSGNLDRMSRTDVAPVPAEPPRTAEAIQTVLLGAGIGREIADAASPIMRPTESASGKEAQACQVELWRGYVSATFYVRLGKSELLESRRFRWRGSSAPPDAGRPRAAYEELVSRLSAGGWQAHGTAGHEWWATIFVRESQRTEQPPALHMREP
jgi:hypothetical protein